MRHRFFDIAFTPAVQAEQARGGSREAYADAAGKADHAADTLTPQEIGFIDARDSFYLASVSETGWPYVQHRGGPPGFVRRVDDTIIGWAEFVDNRQYVSLGNTATDDRVAIILMDYPNRLRLKVLGRLRTYEASDRPRLAQVLAVGDCKARIERLATVAVEAFDWNCPQHITQRFTLAEIERATALLSARHAALGARLGKPSRAAGT